MENEMNLVENVYDLRQNFMIIGLTGRTGSGCTTVANLLKGGFESISSMPSSRNDGITNDERKYKIEYNFLKAIWSENLKFKVIKASDIIFFYAMKEDFDDFCSSFFQVIKHNSDRVTQGADNVETANGKKEKEFKAMLSKLKGEFNNFHNRVIEIDKYIEDRVYERYHFATNRNTKDKESIESELKQYIHFFDEELTQFRRKMMEATRKSQGEQTSLFQLWGDCIRKYGRAYIKEKGKEAEDPSKLAHTINKIIKLIRYYNKLKKRPTFIIIDSLRNPYEVLYFRERYSSFYLISVCTDEKERERNLYKAKFRIEEMTNMDEQEYPSKRKGIDCYYSQDVEKCVELSDIHIKHDNVEVENNIDLKKQIMHIVALILHPGLVQPSHEERLMQIAYTAKFNSGCVSRQVGAVVTDKNFSVKAVGWNTVAKGQTPCSLRSLCDLKDRSDLSAFSEYEKTDNDFRKIIDESWKEYNKLSNTINGKDNNCKCIENLNGLPLAFCFKDYYTVLKKGNKNQVHTRSLHAEENAFLQLAKYGTTGIEGGYLFTTASCCELCAKKAYQLGISRIVYIDIYPGISVGHIIKVGEHEIKVEQFKGIIGRAYEALYNPFFSLKDEIEYLTKVKIEYPIGSPQGDKITDSQIQQLDEATKISRNNTNGKRFCVFIDWIKQKLKNL